MKKRVSEILYQDKWTHCKPQFRDYFISSDFLPLSMHETMRLTGHRGCINTCSFNPSGDLELTGCDDGCVWLWDISRRTQKPKIMLRPHHTNVFTTNFLSENKFISGGNDACVRVTEVLNDGRVMSTCYRWHHVRKVLCSFVIDENTFATCSYDRTIRLFDTRMQYEYQDSDFLPILNEEDMNYDGNEKLVSDLASYGLNSQGEGGGRIDLDVGMPQRDQGSLLLDLRDDNCEIYAMDVHPIDRKKFIVCTGEGTIRMFDLRSLRCGTTSTSGFCVNHHYQDIMNITGVAYDATGERIAASVLGGSIHILDAQLFQDLTTLPPVEMGSRTEQSILRELLMASSSLRGSAVEQEEQLPEEPIHGELQELNRHSSNRTSKAVNWFGDYVVTGSDNGSVFFYNSRDGRVVNILEGHRGCVNVVSVNRPKNLLATSGIDYYSILWRPQSVGNIDRDMIKRHVEECLNTPQGPSEIITCSVQ